MKGLLEFSLPEDREEFEMASKAGALHLVLFQLDQYLRSAIKYPKEGTAPETLDSLQAARDKLYELLSDNGVTL